MKKKHIFKDVYFDLMDMTRAMNDAILKFYHNKYRGDRDDTVRILKELGESIPLVLKKMGELQKDKAEWEKDLYAETTEK